MSEFFFFSIIPQCLRENIDFDKYTGYGVLPEIWSLVSYENFLTGLAEHSFANN